MFFVVVFFTNFMFNLDRETVKGVRRNFWGGKCCAIMLDIKLHWRVIKEPRERSETLGQNWVLRIFSPELQRPFSHQTFVSQTSWSRSLTFLSNSFLLFYFVLAKYWQVLNYQRVADTLLALVLHIIQTAPIPLLKMGIIWGRVGLGAHSAHCQWLLYSILYTSTRNKN